MMFMVILMVISLFYRWFINYLYGLCDLMDDFFFMDVDGDV